MDEPLAGNGPPAVMSLEPGLSPDGPLGAPGGFDSPKGPAPPAVHEVRLDAGVGEVRLYAFHFGVGGRALLAKDDGA